MTSSCAAAKLRAHFLSYLLLIMAVNFNILKAQSWLTLLVHFATHGVIPMFVSILGMAVYQCQVGFVDRITAWRTVVPLVRVALVTLNAVGCRRQNDTTTNLKHFC